MTRKTKPRTKVLTDKELLASAWREVRGAPKVIQSGRSSSTRTAPFRARFEGVCPRCGLFVQIGQEVRYHSDFVSVVHTGCRAPEVTVTTIVEPALVTGLRVPTICSECHLEHAGQCW